MKINVLIILIFFCATQVSFSQEDGVASLAIPVRNSLRFNRFNLNPTFSFVREQNKYISFTNKREWVQFADAPMTYLASFSGRFSENIGVGVGLFQQNYGVLTSFGGILNFAYNARLAQENNLTFGLNLGVYKSGINEGNVVTNTPDPSLNNIPSNFLLSINPGINYGTQFFDFGLSVNNLVQYNINSSEFIEEDPKQSIQAHIMYTGYMDSSGFFDESKFSTLVRSEFQKDNTIVSGVIMLTVPKGIWGQAGYNTIYGFSGGLGLNITEQIAIEYNFEKAVGDLTTFGPSHEITLAYKFKKKENYYYGGNDEETAFVLPKKRRKVLANANTSAQIKSRKTRAEEARLAQEAAAKAKADEEARIAEEKLKEIELQAKAKKEEEARLTQEAAAPKPKQMRKHVLRLRNLEK
ncbi:MAG: PorP/SprF family type IX secretion system membrane protein [Flavobacteriaceae bacterium]